MISRVPTGIPNLDEITDGGFPKGSVVLYYGNTGTGKTYASLKFLQNGIKKLNSTLLITSHHTIPSLVQIGKLLNLDLSKVVCVDAANWRTKRIDRGANSFSKYEVSDLTDLNALLAMIIQACKENKEINRIVFDSLSNLLMYSIPGTEQVLRFFELLTAFIRKNGITFIFTLEKDLHLINTLASFQFLSDGVFEFKKIDGKRFIETRFLQYTNGQQSKHEW